MERRSIVIGARVSGALLGLNGVLGMHGWQWLFILEAVPALLLSVAVLFYLTDKPADAAWLRDDERRWLMDRLAAEERQRVAARHYSVLQALLNPRVLALSLVNFGVAGTIYGLSFFLPQIVKAFGITNLQTGFVSAIPYVVGVISIVWWGHRSDAKLERRFHTSFPIFVAAAGLTVAAFLNDPTAKMWRSAWQGSAFLVSCRCSGRCPPPSCPVRPRPAASPSSTRSAIWRASPGRR